MVIAGLQKTTLLDYPGKVACTVFLAGCNFCCPFCQNWEIITGKGEDISKDYLINFLKKRKGVLDGVCITGGEPLVNADTEDLLKEIKDIGYSVKLDTNGSFPYAATAGCPVDMDKIRESVSFLLSDNIDYELRTTVVDELHDGKGMLELAEWIKGAKRYFLQNFKDSDAVRFGNLSPCSDEKLSGFVDLMRPLVPSVRIRGEN